MTRVYLPATVADLAALLEAGSLAGPRRGHAVTDAVRAEWGAGSPESSEEEWEYEALCLAADDCRELWAELGAEGEPRRRVVVAADVSVTRPDDPDDPTAVVVDHEVPLRRVAAVHADLTEADAAAGDDLAWFATQEIPDLV